MSTWTPFSLNPKPRARPCASVRACVRVAVLSSHQWRRRATLQFLSNPVDEEKREWRPGAEGVFLGVGVAERRGDRRWNGTAITIQDYAACCFRPATSTSDRLICSFLFFFFVDSSEGSLLANLPIATRQQPVQLHAGLHPEERGRSGRGIDPGLPHSDLRIPAPPQPRWRR